MKEDSRDLASFNSNPRKDLPFKARHPMVKKPIVPGHLPRHYRPAPLNLAGVANCTSHTVPAVTPPSPRPLSISFAPEGPQLGSENGECGSQCTEGLH